MDRSDRYTSLVWAAIGAHLAFKGYELGLGALRNPGPGFLIFWGGMVLSGLSLLLFAKSFFHVSQVNGERELWRGFQWHRGAKMIAALLVCTFFFKQVGFILSIFSLLLFLSRGVSAQKWPIAFSFSLITTALCYFVFAVLLDTQFPHGILSGMFGQ